jgi:hypothetical protein
MSKDELEGRVRAIEAILLELPEVTPDVIKAAKTRIRDPKCQPQPDLAEAMLKIGGRLDQHAEKALDNLKAWIPSFWKLLSSLIPDFRLETFSFNTRL